MCFGSPVKIAEAVTQFSEIVAAVEHVGLTLLGGFHPEPQDAVPPAPDGTAIVTVFLLGFIGRDSWAPFAESKEAGDSLPNPLDRWSARKIGDLAGELGANALFPFGGPPYLPFQRWAMRAGSVHPSPLGLLIHPEWGLWYSFRGALGLTSTIDLPPIEQRPSPCMTCWLRPCLAACPVGAFRPDGYAVSRCADHLETSAGTDCMTLGCRARHACPVGTDYSYQPERAAFHMRAFLQGHRPFSGGESAA